MSINPTSPQGAPRGHDPGALESARAGKGQPAGAAGPNSSESTEADRQQQDSVELSSEAKALLERAPTLASRPSLPADRLKELGERLATGFYDQPEVIEQLAKKLASHPDLRGPGGPE